MGCGASQPIQASSPGEEARIRELERKLDAERIQRLELELEKVQSRQARTTVCKPSSHEDSCDGQHQASAKGSGTTPEDATKSPFWTPKRKATFKAVIKGGVKATWALCEEFKDVLPFPGGIGVALIGQVAQLVGTALANKDNLEALLERAAELMDVIIEKHMSQEDLAANQGGSRATKAGSRKYRQLMERLRDLLDVILEYTKDYCGRNFIIKLLMTSADRDQFRAMVDDLAQLMVDAHFSVSVDTHSVTVEVHAMSTEMKSMLEQVRSQTPYMDHSSEVKRMVEELGGIEAVLSSDTKKEQVVNHLDAGQQITIAVLKDQVQAAFLAAAAKKDEGVHTLIQHTDMRTFWRQFFKGLPKVDWDIWWSAFPNHLIKVVQDKAVVEQVVARLSKDADIKRFQEYVEKADPETVSVREVNLAFPYGVSLSEALDGALSLPENEASGASAAAISGSTSTLSEAHDSSRHLQPQSPLSGKIGSCTLPKLESLYVGREKDAEALVHAFRQQLDSRSSGSNAAVCIVAAGAVFVELREACTFEAAMGRICCALDVPMDEHAVQNIKANLKSRQDTFSGPLLMLLDNAEDPISGNEGAQLAGFFIEVAGLAALLITSRVPVAAEKGMQQYELSSMDVTACRALMWSIATDLENSDVDEAVELCRGVPLLVRRAADALQTGQIVLQDLQDAIAGLNDHTLAVLSLTLRTLPRKQQLHLARLSVFPSNFSVVGAAAVLGWSETRSNGLLGVFYRHGLVMRGSSTNLFSLHMAVRTASAALGGEGVVTQGQAHFVVYVFQQLDLWARMFYTPAFEAPLSLAREAGPDILAAFELAGAIVAQQPQPPASMLHSILAVDAALVQGLLSCAGYRRKGTWSKLQRLHESFEGGLGDQEAAALILKSMAAEDYEAADHEAAAKAHDLCCQALGRDHPRSVACVPAGTESAAQVPGSRGSVPSSL